MKVLVFVFLLFSLSSTKELVTFSDVATWFTKLMQNRIGEFDHKNLQDVVEILQRPESNSETSAYRSSNIRTRLECVVCRSLASAFVTSVADGATDEEISNALIVICSGLGIFTYNVCHGAVTLNVPLIGYIMRTTPAASARTFCGLVLQSGTDRLACPYDDPRFEWKVELPEKPRKLPVFVQKNNKPLKVALITDAHIDPLYEAFGVADCNEPTCCRKGQTPANSHQCKTNDRDLLREENFIEENGIPFLNLSLARQKLQHNKNVPMSPNVHCNPEPAGYWGDYRNCDSPVWAFDDAIETIKEKHGDIEVLYYIGDAIDHHVWETSYEAINETNQYIIDKIRKTFGDQVRVVPVIGNHESQPTNQFAPASITHPKLNTTWLYNNLAYKWRHYLPEHAQTTLRKGGDYTVLVRPGLRLISLNTNVAYRYNWWLLYDPSDAKNHLDWLVQELHKAESKGEKVHILTHIPPGVKDLTHTWTKEYNRIVNRFSSTIAAEFNGHTHKDEFRIFYDNDDNPINVAWGAGGIVTYSFYNLNYKIVEFNPNTFEPVSIRNYIYNLTQANLTPEKRPSWFLLYEISKGHELDDLSPKTMNDLVHSMVTDKRPLLDLYASFNTKESDILMKNCDDECKLETLCQTVITVLWDRRKCDELKRLFHS